VEAQPLDIPLVGLTLTAPQDAAWGPNLIRQVTKADWKDTMDAVGITDGEPAYEFLQVLFGQDAAPRLVYLGKRATPVAQQTDFLLDGGAGPAADGLYRLTLGGVNYDHTASSETRAQVITALQILVDAATRFTAAVGGTPETLDVTAAEAGAGFAFAASAPIGESWTITPTQASVGLSSDLTAWNDELSDWYLATVPEAVSEDVADDMAATLQSFIRDITAHLRTDSATDPNAPAGTGAATALAPKGYSRLTLVHIPTATDYGHAAAIGLKMSTLPGSDTWANKRVRVTAGTAWSFAQRANLESGPYALLDAIPSLERAITGNYRVLDGTPYDVIRGADYLTASIIAAVLTTLTKTPAPSYTPEGFGEIGAAISGELADFVSTGFLAQSYPDGQPGYSVTIPDVPPPGDPLRAQRKTPPFTFTALVNGSIEVVVDIDGVLIQ
jgi:hypothetical protein